jgi:hypothetical protein
LTLKFPVMNAKKYFIKLKFLNSEIDRVNFFKSKQKFSQKVNKYLCPQIDYDHRLTPFSQSEPQGPCKLTLKN